MSQPTQGAEHRVVGRERVPGNGPCEHTSERVTCSCGRSLRSIFPWIIRRWMTDHDFMTSRSA